MGVILAAGAELVGAVVRGSVVGLGGGVVLGGVEVLGDAIGGEGELQANSKAVIKTTVSRYAGDFIDGLLFGDNPIEDNTPLVQPGFRCSLTKGGQTVYPLKLKREIFVEFGFFRPAQRQTATIK
jgi:hypothetical protein